MVVVRAEVNALGRASGASSQRITRSGSTFGQGLHL